MGDYISNNRINRINKNDISSVSKFILTWLSGLSAFKHTIWSRYKCKYEPQMLYIDRKLPLNIFYDDPNKISSANDNELLFKIASILKESDLLEGYYKAVLANANGNISKAARIVNLKYNTFRDRLKKFGIKIEKIRPEE